MRATPPTLPEVIFSDERNRRSLSRGVRRGTLARLATGIYSTQPRRTPEEIVGRNLYTILDHELPGAIITDRSGRRIAPADRMVTVVHAHQRPLELPGLTIAPRRGLPALPGDTELYGSLVHASQARVLLENLAARRHPRYLSREELELWIDELIRLHGQERINLIRDQARRLATAHGLERASTRLDEIIGAALATRPVEVLETPSLRARADGRPYDQRRLERFAALVAELRELAPDPLPLFAQDAPRRRLLPFYEAYFSNYIEGTEFTLDEAAEIVFDRRMPSSRPADAHDILGTYQLVSDEREMARTPRDADQLIALLKARHRVLMEGRPDMTPGEFKTRNNQAGSTLFVAPEMVEATLREGFTLGHPLIDPFAHAVYIAFVVSEVHPFADGNGRIARVMMNAELSAEAQARIVVPTVFRNNYISALKAATHNGSFAALMAALRFAQRWTARVDFSSRQSAETDLTQTNALRDPNEAEDTGVRLVLPAR